MIHLTLENEPVIHESVLVIGVGNAFRRDDDVGQRVAQAIGALNLPAVKTCTVAGEGADLINLWRDVPAVILVDAAASGAPPGTVHRLDADERMVSPVIYECSSHAYGVADAIELSRLLGQLPPRLVVYGIEGKDFTMGQGLSGEVEQAIPLVVAQIRDDIESVYVRNRSQSETCCT